MPAIDQIEVSSLGDLLDQATPDTHDPHSGRLRDCAIYRGLENADYTLLTSLDRLGGLSPPHSKIQLEGHILRNFVRYARPYVTHDHNCDWEFLVTAQHHGLATRLLDWSYSPLVAAHFATFKGEPGTDRVVWKLDWNQLHQHYNLPSYSILDLDTLLSDRQIGTVWDLFESGDVGNAAFVCNLEPPSVDARVVAQSAAFTLSTCKTSSVDELLVSDGLGSALKRFIIPASRVDFIRDQLDICSVDERRLFPDLDGVAAEMTRYYSTSPAQVD